jgi:carboxymethylenebutenolidase
VAVTGFCWGGGAANQIAVRSPIGLAAVAPFYGMQAGAEDAAKIRVPLVLHYGALDERINAGIPAYEAALKKAGVKYQGFIYEGANHAFFNDTAGPRYAAAAAKRAWGRRLAFFKEENA